MKSIKYIPFQYTHPKIKGEILLEFERFYDEQKYILGPGLKRFEKKYAEFNQVKYGIGVSNGHDALQIILQCLDIGQGNEVILPAHTFTATALSVINVGATPVFVDINPFSLNIDHQKIASKISKNTKAIIPVHLYGNPCAMDDIMKLAESYQIPLIEDNAQAQGAEFQGRKTGSIGIMNFTSFYPTKNIGALGDAGMITTDIKNLAEKAFSLRNYGKSKDGKFTLPGKNSRMDELQAGLLSVKLRYVEDWNNDRIQIAELYESKLKEIDEIQMQYVGDGNKNVRHIFPVLCRKRNELKQFLYSKGIETLIHYETPVHLQEVFSFLGHKVGDYTAAENVCSSELSLPIYPGLSAEEINYICEQITYFYAKH